VKSSAIQMPVIEEVAANQEVPQQHLRHSDTPLSCLAVVELPCVVLVLLELSREVRQIALPWETRAVVQEFVLEFAQIFEEGEDAPALPVNDALVLK